MCSLANACTNLCQLLNWNDSISCLFKIFKSCAWNFFPIFMDFKLVYTDCSSTKLFEVHLLIREWLHLGSRKMHFSIKYWKKSMLFHKEITEFRIVIIIYTIHMTMGAQIKGESNLDSERNSTISSSYFAINKYRFLFALIFIICCSEGNMQDCNIQFITYCDTFWVVHIRTCFPFIKSLPSLDKNSMLILGRR